MMKRFYTFFLILLTLSYWLPVAGAQDFADVLDDVAEPVAEEGLEEPVEEVRFPTAGPKIEGPWLWMLLPTSEPGGARAAASGIDFLARASGGSVTEQQIAASGATAGDAVGDQVWTPGKLSPVGWDNITQMLDDSGLDGDVEHHVVYGSIVLDAPQDQNTTMYVGTDDAVKVWLNGILVHSNPEDRGAHDYQESFPVVLKEGKNILLVAVYEWKYAWSGFFGFEADAVYSPRVALPVHIDAAHRPPIYWTDNGGIYALRGTDVHRLLPAVDTAISIAVEPSLGKIYWTAVNLANPKRGTLNSANLDGSGATVLADIYGTPLNIAVDAAAGRLYWTDVLGRLQRSSLTGTNIGNVVRDIPQDILVWLPSTLAVADGNIYWTQSGRIRYANISGETRTIHDLITGLDEPLSIAIAGNKLYWLESAADGSGKLQRINLDGTQVEVLKGFATLYDTHLAVDRTQQKLYLIGSGGKLSRRELAGTGYTVVVSGLQQPVSIAIASETPAEEATATPKTPTPTQTASTASKYDLNADGTVDIMDVDIVFTALASENPPATPGKLDVNGDGQLTLHDLVAVSQNIETSNAAAAPARYVKLTGVQIHRIQEQIHLLQTMKDTSLGVQRTLAYLQNLLAAARPEKTQLLANYPNPFNPETWIPYELATDTDVKITIYNTQGRVIRTLLLGQQSAGYYTDRERAAYWDGRNALGEHVASGVYFYQLETDEMSTLRKMVILK